MPYIQDAERPEVEDFIVSVVRDLNHHPLEEKRAKALAIFVQAILKNRTYHFTRGQYNYILTQVTVRSLELDTNPRYDRINDALGALDLARSNLGDSSNPKNRGILRCVDAELYRRLAIVYENDKIAENGDISCYDHLPTPTNGE